MIYKITIENDDGDIVLEETTSCVLLCTLHERRNERIEEEGGKVFEARTASWYNSKAEIAVAMQALIDDERIKEMHEVIKTTKMS